MYEKTLVPVDGSETAALGLNETIRLASNQGGNIWLVHILNELVVASPYETGVGMGRGIDI